MCEFVEECREEGRIEGRLEERTTIIKNLLLKLSVDKVIELGFDKEIVIKTASTI